MKKRVFFLLVLGLVVTCTVQAQRVADRLTRGIVAIPQGDKTGQDSRYGTSGSGIFVSWRKLATEYYDTEYNLYRNGTKVNAEPLTVTNYQDNNGTKASKYKVVPVVKGQEQAALASEEVTPWDHQYWDIPVKPVIGRDGVVATGYSLNDCSVADVDGDGQMEFVVKRRNDNNSLNTSANKTNFNLHECYKMDGTRLWWIDMGPNLMAGPDEQFDLILYDWDQDGKAEALMRGADNMIIHTKSGQEIKIGNMNYYAPRDEYTKEGAEYLLYLNGETGEPYGWDGSPNWTPEAYPLPRYEQGESNYAAVWGNNDTGHRATKHYFGAPYLDGRNASIFLGRGCYTRHKFCALDVDKTTHKLTQRWRWNCYAGGSPWFGNGFHNFAIADVDCDGRDEIVFGSMIIDDTGYGLSTTGYGHGDAQHCGDLDPYRWGLEQFVCLEGSNVPGICYTGATASDIRYQNGSGGDQGRCMAGNFVNSYPGALGLTYGTDAIGLVSDKVITGVSIQGDDYLNMRVYWDGDLLDEFMDSPGVEKAPCVYKAPGQTEVGTGRAAYANGRCWMGEGNLNNSSKNNPGFLGDIIGDWREEIVVRTGNALRIYTSSYESPWAVTTLWADHEYRNGMTWQSVGYNQPPHVSFFLGELEGITKEPPAVVLEGRTEVTGTIRTTADHLLISGYEDKTFAVEEGASPWVLTVNAPAWVKGSGSQQAVASTPKQPNRTVESYTTTLTGGAFGGATHLVKQGEGTLVLPNVTEKHTGATDIWQGTLQFDGTMQSSPVWLNRHTSLVSNGGKFMGGLKADYNATIYPGGKETVGSITASTLQLGFGSRIVIDAKDGQFDQLNATHLTIETKATAAWKNYGPRYKAPVLQINAASVPAVGTYTIGSVTDIEGNVANLLIEGIDNSVRASLRHEGGKLLLVIEEMREAGMVTWNGESGNNTWQQAVTENFLADGKVSVQAFGDDIVFDDQAASTSVVISGAVSPNSVTFNNETKSYTVSGDSIVGGGTITKNGKGLVSFTNWNHTGNTTINEGVVAVTMLANNAGQDWGALGNAKSQIYLNDGATLRTNGVIVTDQTLNVSGEVNIDVPANKSVIWNKAIKGSGAVVNKTGSGSMETGTQTNTYAKLVIKAGTVSSNHSSSLAEMLPKTVEFQGGTLWGANNESSNVTNTTNFVVPQGKTGSFYSSFRGTYTGTLTGEGTFNVYTGGVRAYFDGDWSQFSGTVNIGKNNRQNKKSYDPSFMFRNAKGMPLATVNVNEGARLSNEGTSIRVKKFGGRGALVGSGTWIVDCDENFSLTTEVGITSERTDDYGGTIGKSASNLTKRGEGKMVITAGRMNGSLAVEGGTVAFNNAALATLVHGAYTTTVRNGGRVAGQGLLNAVVLQSGAELMPCAASLLAETMPGTIKCNNTINVQAGAVLRFIVGSTKNSMLDTKNLTLNGTVMLTLNRELKAGDELTLWTVSGTFSGTPQFDLPAGYEWDTSRISEGILKVAAVNTGIRAAQGDADPRNVYDLQGRLVRRQATAISTEGLPTGIYLRGGRKVIVKK